MLRKKFLHFDYILLLLVFLLIIIGITAVGSATRINTVEIALSSEFLHSEFMSQITWVALGTVVLFFAAFIDYKFIAKFYILIYIANITLLVVLLLFGKPFRNVYRWIFGIQPSEFAKIFMIIFIATFIHKNKDSINKFFMLLFLCVLTLIPVLLIQAQPSLSASLVILVILVAQLFAGNLSNKYIKIVLMILVPISVIIIIDLTIGNQFILHKILSDYQIDRITSILSFDLTTDDPSLYQTKNSAWAIGSGQLLGKGLFNGIMNQLKYIPYSLNDFIFSVIGEEFGFIGCVIVLALMLLIIAKCLIIASKATDMLGSLIVVGVAALLSFQTFINIGVATGLLPNTGMPLPFLSAGGSSMMINMACIGLVLNVGMTKPKKIFKK